MKKRKGEDLVEKEMEQYNRQLSKHFNADVIVLSSAMTFGLDDEVRDFIEVMRDKSTSKTHLCVLLRSVGGYIEVVERIYNVFRKHYSTVTFVVPDYAYSAGTVLALSGDEIYMDYYAVLGPIDPQFQQEDGQFTSGIGYLHKFNELMELVNKDPTGGANTRGQLSYLLKRFDPARLFHIEQARDYAINLLKQWLPKHKWKNWAKTETQGNPVDQAYKESRAEIIGNLLAEPRRWHSHGRGIGIRELTSDEIKLKIQDFGNDQKLNPIIRGYHDLFVDFCNKIGVESALHGPEGLRRL